MRTMIMIMNTNDLNSLFILNHSFPFSKIGMGVSLEIIARGNRYTNKQ